MSTPSQQAIEAAVNAYGYTNAFGPERETRMSAALTAALPELERQIREQVAREIEAATPLAYYPHESGYQEAKGMKRASRIAQGKE